MSRRKKNLRAFRHQHPANDMTIEETWDAAWEGAQKHYHSKRMQELEAELEDTVTECLAAKSNEDILRKQLAELREAAQATTERHKRIIITGALSYVEYPSEEMERLASPRPTPPDTGEK